MSTDAVEQIAVRSIDGGELGFPLSGEDGSVRQIYGTPTDIAEI
jgi:hypothetical protein